MGFHLAGIRIGDDSLDIKVLHVSGRIIFIKVVFIDLKSHILFDLLLSESRECQGRVNKVIRLLNLLDEAENLVRSFAVNLLDQQMSFRYIIVFKKFLHLWPSPLSMIDHGLSKADSSRVACVDRPGGRKLGESEDTYLWRF